MQTFQTIGMQVQPQRLSNLRDFLVARARGKSVLHVGAAGGIHAYLPDHRERFLHHDLTKAAREIIGIDIDSDGIEHAALHGETIMYADCEELDLGRTFDTIVMLDVIEHLERPGVALDRLMAHLDEGGELIISTPNPTHFGMFMKILLHRPLEVYWDHITSFMPENLQVLCNSHGYRISELFFYTHPNEWSFGNRVKTAINRAVSVPVKRWSNAFIVVVRAE